MPKGNVSSKKAEENKGKGMTAMKNNGCFIYKGPHQAKDCLQWKDLNTTSIKASFKTTIGWQGPI